MRCDINSAIFASEKCMFFASEKVYVFIAKYPVFGLLKALYTVLPLAYQFIPIPIRLLREAF